MLLIIILFDGGAYVTQLFTITWLQVHIPLQLRMPMVVSSLLPLTIGSNGGPTARCHHSSMLPAVLTMEALTIGACDRW